MLAFANVRRERCMVVARDAYTSPRHFLGFVKCRVVAARHALGNFLAFLTADTTNYDLVNSFALNICHCINADTHERRFFCIFLVFLCSLKFL